MAEPGFEPVASGWEARMPPLCYAAPTVNLKCIPFEENVLRYLLLRFILSHGWRYWLYRSSIVGACWPTHGWLLHWRYRLGVWSLATKTVALPASAGLPGELTTSRGWTCNPERELVFKKGEACMKNDWDRSLWVWIHVLAKIFHPQNLFQIFSLCATLFYIK